MGRGDSKEGGTMSTVWKPRAASVDAMIWATGMNPPVGLPSGWRTCPSAPGWTACPGSVEEERGGAS